MDDASQMTAEARIRSSALRLFAERGYSETTVRAIAEDVGISPGLILHHYGSKEGLRDAVNEEVVRTILGLADQYLDVDAPLDQLFEEGGSDLRTLLAARPELGAYLRRLFFDGDQAGLQILERLMELGRTYSATMEERGVIRRPPDPEMRDLQALILDLCPVLFGPLFAAYFRVPPLDEELYRRWIAAEFDLFARGLFTQSAITALEERLAPATERNGE